MNMQHAEDVEMRLHRCGKAGHSRPGWDVTKQQQLHCVTICQIWSYLHNSTPLDSAAKSFQALRFSKRTFLLQKRLFYGSTAASSIPTYGFLQIWFARTIFCQGWSWDLLAYIKRLATKQSLELCLDFIGKFTCTTCTTSQASGNTSMLYLCDWRIPNWPVTPAPIIREITSTRRHLRLQTCRSSKLWRRLSYLDFLLCKEHLFTSSNPHEKMNQCFVRSSWVKYIL
jgi:hypothetical protein